MSDGSMLALTLWPEWAWAIVALDKRVENRTWRPPASLVGQRIGIHAGKNIGGKRGRVYFHDGLVSVSCMAAGWHDEWAGDDEGNVIAIDFFCADREHHARLDADITTSALVATAVLTGADRDMLTGWDVPDAWHWRLADVVVLDPPIPMRGAQGLWKVPAEVPDAAR